MKAIIVGLGVVGMGLGRRIATEREKLFGDDRRLQVVAVVDSRGAAVDRDGLDMKAILRRKLKTGRAGPETMNAIEVIKEVEADVAVELTPGTLDGEPAHSHFRAAFESSKSVVTANKMPLALHYTELLSGAEKRGLKILYGACVGGGLPVLEFGSACAAAEEVESVDGVLNATTNYILSEMENGRTYQRALNRAKELGYAEPDPSFDVDGLDSACKAVILANHVMGRSFRLGDVKPLTGIGGVTSSSVMRAHRKGRPLRLVARAGKSLSVGLTEVPKRSPLAAQGRSHAVVFHLRYSGERAITGAGAGPITTSLGVLRDLIALEQGIGA